MEIDLSLQDFYWSDAPGDMPPITPETWETWFQEWLEQSAADLPPAPIYELSLRLTSDQEIQQLNAQYRNKDLPTDVLAFAALEVDLPESLKMSSSLPLYLGDIVISVDTANQQANSQGHSLETELAWLATHGLLHLLGWDHPDEDSLKLMLTEQDKLLRLINLEPRNFNYL